MLDQIQLQIQRTAEDPDSWTAFDDQVRHLDPRIDRVQLQQVVAGYTTATPQLLTWLLEQAYAAGVGAEAEALVGNAVEYFQVENDVIPDRLGMLGLLDDAYYANLVVAAANGAYQAQAGRPLVANGLDRWHPVVRSIIGEPCASAIEQIAVEGIQATLQHAQSMARASWDATGGPGSWGGTWEDEMARVGASIGISFE